MPSDGLGVILDTIDVAARVTEMLQLASELLPRTGRASLAVGLSGLWQVTEGSASDLGRRSSTSLPIRQADAALVEPRDSVPVEAVGRAPAEIARELATRLVLRFREMARW